MSSGLQFMSLSIKFYSPIASTDPRIYVLHHKCQCKMFLEFVYTNPGRNSIFFFFFQKIKTVIKFTDFICHNKNTNLTVNLTYKCKRVNGSYLPQRSDHSTSTASFHSQRDEASHRSPGIVFLPPSNVCKCIAAECVSWQSSAHTYKWPTECNNNR